MLQPLVFGSVEQLCEICYWIFYSVHCSYLFVITAAAAAAAAAARDDGVVVASAEPYAYHCCRQMTGTSPLSFYSLDALPAAQPTASKH